MCANGRVRGYQVDHGGAVISKAAQWTIWAIFFFPIMILANGAMKMWGIASVMALLVAMLAASLLAARYISDRSWHSIMWGDRK